MVDRQLWCRRGRRRPGARVDTAGDGEGPPAGGATASGQLPADHLVRPGRLVRAAGGAAAAALAWGLFEAQWVQCRRLSIGVPGLPTELAGLRILHLSDPHLGSVSLNARALEQAVSFGRRCRPGPGRRHRRSPGAAARRGDVAPRARRREGGPRLLRRARQRRPRRHAGSVQHRWRGRARSARQAARRRVGSGRHQRTDGPDRRAEPGEPLRSHAGLADPESDLRILLAHFPEVVDLLPQGSFELVLSGHTHDGQICLPYPGGKVRFGGVKPPYPEGVFELPGTTLVVSRRFGTTFVPFRFSARPEASLLVLEPAPAPGRAAPVARA